MADELLRTKQYTPRPSNDVWAIGLLLLQLLGGDWAEAHYQALSGGFEPTLAYAQSLRHLPRDRPYLSQVSNTIIMHVLSLHLFETLQRNGTSA